MNIHLLIGRQRPQVVGDERFELVGSGTYAAHRRQHRCGMPRLVGIAQLPGGREVSTQRGDPGAHGCDRRGDLVERRRIGLDIDGAEARHVRRRFGLVAQHGGQDDRVRDLQRQPRLDAGS